MVIRCRSADGDCHLIEYAGGSHVRDVDIGDVQMIDDVSPAFGTLLGELDAESFGHTVRNEWPDALQIPGCSRLAGSWRRRWRLDCKVVAR